MCMFRQPSYPAPQMPKEYAAQQAPDGAAVRTAAGRRATDRARSAPGTIKTSPTGVSTPGATQRTGLVPMILTDDDELGNQTLLGA